MKVKKTTRTAARIVPVKVVLTEAEERMLREAMVEPVRVLLQALVGAGMDPEKAGKAVRWATHVLTNEAKEMT